MKEKRTIFQRVLAFMLSLVMVFGLIVTPDFAAVVHASGIGGEGEPVPPVAEKNYTVSLSMEYQGTYYVGDTYKIVASVTDESGTSLQDGTWLVSSVGADVKEDTANGGFTFSASSAGTYTITATYTDNDGRGEGSTTITVVNKPIVTVSGKVVDAYQNQLIKGANVVFDSNSGKVETTTGDNGAFSAVLIQNESYTMTVSKDGYSSYTGNPKAYTTDTTESDVVLTTNQVPNLSAPDSITYNDKNQKITLTDPPEGWSIDTVSSSTTILEATKANNTSVNLIPKGIGSSTVTVTAHGVSSSVTIQVVQDTVVPNLQITKENAAISETNKVYPKDKISAELTLKSKVDSNNVSVEEGSVVMSLMKKGTNGAYEVVIDKQGNPVQSGALTLSSQNTSVTWNNIEIPEKGDYTIGYTYTKGANGYYTSVSDVTAIGAGFSVGYKAGQEITFKSDKLTNVTYSGTYSVPFTAKVADKTRAENVNNWIVTPVNGNENVKNLNVQISSVSDTAKEGFYAIEGSVTFRAVKAVEAAANGGFTLTFSHVDDTHATDKVYGDAVQTCGQFEIAPKELTVNSVTYDTLDPKVYDGETNANVKEISLTGITDIDQNGVDDEVSVVNCMALVFDGKDAGKHSLNTKEVKLVLGGKDSANYTINQETNIKNEENKGTIEKRVISVTVSKGIEIGYYSDELNEQKLNTIITQKITREKATSFGNFVSGEETDSIEQIIERSYLPTFKVVAQGAVKDIVDKTSGMGTYDIIAIAPTENEVMTNYEYNFSTNTGVGTMEIVASDIERGTHYQIQKNTDIYIADEGKENEKIWVREGTDFVIEPMNNSGYNTVQQPCPANVSQDGTFTFNLQQKNGNDIIATSKGKPESYLVENTLPVGTIQISDHEPSFSDVVLNTITFGIFKKKDATFTITAEDKQSDIQEIQYKIVSYQDYKDDIGEDKDAAKAYLDKLSWEDYAETEKFADEQNSVVCAKLVDNVGHITYISTEGIVIDGTAPSDITLSIRGDKSGYYNDNVTVDVRVGNSAEFYSGINSITYKVSVNDKVLVDEKGEELRTLYTGPNGGREAGDLKKDAVYDSTRKENPNKPIKISAEECNIKTGAGDSNKVQVEVTVTDRAGNEAKKTIGFDIDKNDPALKVSFGENEEEPKIHDKHAYFKNQRTATIEIDEANFDPSGLNVEINSGSIDAVEKGTWESKGTKHTLTYVFGENENTDKDVTFDVSYTDKAGNSTRMEDKTGYNKKFTIDRVVPVVSSVEYTQMVGSNTRPFTPGESEKDRYYGMTGDGAIYADITITERNFNSADKKDIVTVGQQGENYQEWYSEWTSTKGQSQDTHTFRVNYPGDANYIYDLTFTDLAGNSIADYKADYFTVDTAEPSAKMKVNKFDTAWDAFVNAITFGLFTNDKDAKVEIYNVADVTSGHKDNEFAKNQVVYKVYNEASDLSESEFKNLPDTEWETYDEKKNIPVPPNKNYVVYAKITDPSGNKKIISSNGFIVDDKWADIEITLLQKLGHIYTEKEEVKIHITVKEPEKYYSGLKSVGYKVVKDGVVDENMTTVTGGVETVPFTSFDVPQTDEIGVQTFETDVIIDKEANNSNHVALYVQAVDKAGNVTTKVQEIAIDITAPTIELTFDNNNVENVKYYQKPRTATVKITERSENFDPENVEMHIKNSNLVKVSDWKSIENADGDYNHDKHIATVTFDQDGDYNMTIDFKDNAGNAAKQVQVADFTIDNIDPELKVVYDNNDVLNEKYYNAPRKATLTIDEHNFRASDVKITMTAENNHQPVELPIVSEWETDPDPKKADLHTATILYDKDADYTFDIEYTDLSGRAMKDYKQDVFVVDNTDPVITVNYFAVQADGTRVDITEDVNVSSKDAIKYVNRDYVSFEADMIIQELNFNQEDVEYSANGTKHDTKMEDAKSGWTTQEDGITRTKNIKFVQQDIYKVDLVYADLAGRKAQFVNDNNEKKYETDYICLDTIDPEGVLTVTGSNPNAWTNTWDYKNGKEDATFTRYTQTASGVTLEVKDDTSGVKAYYYAKSPVVISGYENLETLDWGKALNLEELKAQITETPGQQFIPFVKVVDYADNIAYYGGDGVIVDNQKPGPVVTITPAAPPYGKGIYKASENPTYNVTVTENPNSPNAGIDFIHYTVYCDGKASSVQDVALNSEAERKEKKFSVNLADFYKDGDSVYIVVEAADRAANNMDSYSTLTNSQDIAIDNTVPTGLRIEMDSSDVSNSKYYNNNKTAYVYVTEHNFDSSYRPEVTGNNNSGFSIGSWENIGGDNWRCAVTFTGDGDYSMLFECVDLAGHHSDSTATLSEFTVDKTLPEITVSYDNNDARNGNYFKETRTATVTIREHNFNAADVRAAVTASLEGKGVSTPSIGAFSGSGDTHTASVSYSTDGDYTFDIDYTDMAGNAAADYTQDSFTVDLTAPELEITDVEDKSANNDAVSPKVEATDVNYDTKGVTLTLTGANNGKVEVGTVVSAIQNGQSMKFNDFARTEEMDDLYKLTAKVVDKAGNETEKEIMFSVNRYGSVFILDDNTKDWLMTEEGYTYIREEKEVGIREINVDNIESRSITVNRDGDLASLKENTDFTVKASGSEVQWKEAHYTIAKENFAEEGNYTVILNTQDKAKNNMNNTSVKKANKNLPIEFAVDKTAPTVVVSGVEDDAQYRSAEKTMTVDAKDNLALTKVAISIDGTETVYEGEELQKDNGVIEAAIASANRWQSIEITAEDAAGNVLGQSEQKLEGEPVVLRILVTPNIVIQYYMNKPLFYGSIAAVVVMLGLIVFLVWRKKQQK